MDNTTQTKNTQTIQSIYAAFTRGDIPAILAQLSDDVDWNNDRVASKECPWNGNFSGKANVPGFFKAVGENLDITVFDARAFLESEGHVAVFLRVASTVRKNGKPLKNDVMHLWKFNSKGQVSGYRHFNDTAAELVAWRA